MSKRFWFRALVGSVLVLGAPACGGKQEKPAPMPETDADTDTDSDTDADSDTDTTPPLVLVEVCNDDMDNDNDLLKDCFDPDCQLTCDADSDGVINEPLGGPDCDDSNASVYPGAPELCDGVDNNCDELVDDDDPKLVGATGIAQFFDGDADGYGAKQVPGCLLLPGNSLTGGDCKDNDPAISPAALELCDLFDNNCDLLIDEDDPSIDPTLLTTFWIDADKDAFGDGTMPVDACFQGKLSTNGDDCNDHDPAIQGC